MKYINCTEIDKYKAAELPKQAQFTRQFVSPDFGYCIRGHIFIIIRGEGVSNHLMLFIKFVTSSAKIRLICVLCIFPLATSEFNHSI